MTHDPLKTPKEAQSSSGDTSEGAPRTALERLAAADRRLAELDAAFSAAPQVMQDLEARRRELTRRLTARSTRATRALLGAAAGFAGAVGGSALLWTALSLSASEAPCGAVVHGGGLLGLLGCVGSLAAVGGGGEGAPRAFLARATLPCSIVLLVAWAALYFLRRA
ncbi:MAG: hypothetical protein IT371_16295 [Deltaproteobacteria bacterium]|nr:hypothetical protein [Deltaproteobacteria bacterium]